VVSALLGCAVAFPYLFLTKPVNPRYLLPAYALLVIPAAVGISEVTQRVKWKAVAVTALAVLLLGWAAWQVSTANRIEADNRRLRTGTLDVARALKARAAGEPCAFASNTSWTQIQFASGCVGRNLNAQGMKERRRVVGRGKVYVVGRTAGGTPEIRAWTYRSLNLRRAPGWHIWEPPGQASPSVSSP